MSVFHPTLYLDRITGLSLSQLEAWGIKGLILDVDNTLTTHDNPIPDPAIRRWLEEAAAAGIRMIILSNNHPPRVKPFAEILGLPFTADAAKPLSGGYRRATQELGLSKEEVAVVGDQIFTDILGGNLFGIRSVLVQPIQPEENWFFRLKRRLEGGILRSYEKKQSKENRYGEVRPGRKG